MAMPAAKARTKKAPSQRPSQQKMPMAAPQGTISPVPSPERTSEEQALIDEWWRRRRAVPQAALRETGDKRELLPPTSDHALWGARLAQALKIDDPGLLALLLTQVSSCVWKMDAEQALNTTVAAVAGIGPRDQLEAFLAVQMVGVHNTALELLRRALIPDQTVEGVTLGVQRATQLLRTFTTQVETLVRYRGGGRQTVTVEHVHVNAGGQAVVGAVQHHPGHAGGGEDDGTK
jgi:hypothetical protein